MSIRDEGIPPAPGEASPVVTLATRTGMFLSFAGASIAMGVWFVLRRDLVVYCRDNTLLGGNAWNLLLTLIATGAAFSAVAAVYCLAHRTRRAVLKAHRVASMLLPLALVFALPIFFRLELWKDRELFFASTVLIWGFVLERSLQVAFEVWPPATILAVIRVSRVIMQFLLLILFQGGCCRGLISSFRPTTSRAAGR